MRKTAIALLAAGLALAAGCGAPPAPAPPTPGIAMEPAALPTKAPADASPAARTSAPPPSPAPTPAPLLAPDGNTIRERFPAPEGYERQKGNVFEEYLRDRPLLPDGSPVYLYDGTLKGNQDAHLAVLDIDTGERDRQQCADAALRLRCEFLFATGQFERINYHFVSGDEFPYVKYRDGYRLKVSGNDVSLTKTAGRDDSYKAFRRYLDLLFSYASTISLEKESAAVDSADMRVGDIFIKGGSPGHCVIVLDMCADAQGRKLFLIGQGYMPAQQIHVLKGAQPGSPWYALDELSYPFDTPEYTFMEPCLRRMP